MGLVTTNTPFEDTLSLNEAVTRWPQPAPER